MPIYTVIVTLKVYAESENEAYGFIRHALDNAKKAELIHIDSEVIDRTDDDEDAPPTPEKLTRQEQLQALADRGCDTWEDYRGEK